jgi:uncharacterized protein YegL
MRVTGAKKNQKLTDVAEPVVQVTALKSRIHNVFIIDASGSMSGAKYENAILGVNELLNNITQDTDTDNTVMIVEFEGKNVVRRLDMGSPYSNEYTPMGTGGMTPLNQAIGETLEYVTLRRKTDFDVNDKVLVNIFTDGDENSSMGKYAKPHVVSEFIKKLEDEGFTITFIGTQSEVNYAINTLSMDASNTLVHTNTASSIKKSFDTTVMARSIYSKSVSKGEDVKANFYTKTMK